MTSHPAFTERNIHKSQRLLCPRFSSAAKIFDHVSHFTELVRMCLACHWLQKRRSPGDICEQWGRNLSSGLADVCGAGTRDEPLKSSGREANKDMISIWSVICTEFTRSCLCSFFRLKVKNCKYDAASRCRRIKYLRNDQLIDTFC